MQLPSQTIKQSAQTCGFDLCGIAKAETLYVAKERFKEALARNYHAKKEYLERNIDKRFQPTSLLENCKSVVVCGFNYNMRRVESNAMAKSRKHSSTSLTEVKEESKERLKISQYALIKDYHLFMKEKLENLAVMLQEKLGVFKYKTTIDSSTISEKAWAVQAGIGCYGKNSIIQTALGSFVFFGILLIDKEIDKYDTPNTNTCGDCNRCIVACPTQAIVAPFCVDCNHCITHYNTNKNTDFKSIAKYGWLYACDVCQNVCPNNVHAPVSVAALAMKAPFAENKEEILENLTPESFEHFFIESVIYKFKYEGLKKRVEDIEKNNLSLLTD